MLVVNNLNCSFFFFNDTATTEIYTLSLHDALPISDVSQPPVRDGSPRPDLHRMTVQPVDRRKAVFVGGVIADEHRRPPPERLLLHELQHRHPLVLSGRLHFDDALARLHTVLAADSPGQRADEPVGVA